MDRADFATVRILLLAGKTHGAQTLRAVLGIAGITKIIAVEHSRRAIELLSSEHYDAVFADESCEPVNGLTFALAARSTGTVLNPMIPIFVFQEQAYRRSVEKARDTGATDFITSPISPKTVMDKLESAIANPKPFIKAPGYFGPDRRSKDRPTYFGKERRVRIPKKVKIQIGVNPTLLD